MFYAQSTSAVISARQSKVSKLMFYAQSTSAVIRARQSKVSKLMFYAQSTSAVIRARQSKDQNEDGTVQTLQHNSPGLALPHTDNTARWVSCRSTEH